MTYPLPTTDLRAAAGVLGKAYLANELPRADYRERLGRLEARWRQWLTDTYLPNPDISHSVEVEVWNRAWEEGHSEGYERVEQCFEDLATLVNLAVTEALEYHREH